MEICDTSALTITMVPRLHQSNGYMKRKLRAWRVQNYIALVGADTVLTSAWKQSTRFMVGSIGPRMEICETSALPIPMVPRLQQRNGDIKRKLRARRVQKCIAQVGADTILTTVWKQIPRFMGDSIGPKIVSPYSVQIPNLPLRGSKLPRFMGGIGPRMEICGNSGLHILMVPRLHQSNGCMKRKLRAWRVQKCIALVGANTILTSLGPETTPFHGR